MTTGKGYKDQAANVRHEARLRLAELRQERQRKRRSLQNVVGADETSGNVPEDSSVLERPTPPASVDVFRPATNDNIVAVREHSIDGPDDKPEIVTISGAVTEQADDIASLTKASDTTAEIADEADQSTNPASDDGIATDLRMLPGAGDALIWMLKECDIHSLADLAAAEADDLSDRLGLVGRILNVQTWVDFARDRQTA